VRPGDPLVGVPAPARGLFSPELAGRLLDLRHDLHRHPELSRQEHATARRLAGELRELGAAEVMPVAETGLVARFPGRQQGAPTVALRGDIDALPITEATGLPFASENAGVMHACGHDVHAAWTVGAAALLAAEPAAGDVLVVLQPAEEIAWGAREILATGALDKAAAIFGGHVDRRFEVGQVVAQEGPLAASSDSFEIELIGRGAHGARPQESADPIVGAAALVGALQTIVSRRLDPGLPGVVTVGKIAGGSAPNIIPDRAFLAGTLRATRPESRDLLLSELQRITAATAALHRLEAEVHLLGGTPPVVNTAEASAWAREAVAELLGPAALVPLGQVNMAGEDFAFYLEKMPGCFLRIGARESGGEVLPAHNPRFHAAEGAVFVGAAVLAAIARRASAALADRHFSSGTTSPSASTL